MGAEGAGVFLDRDGTIIEDRDYPGDPDGVRLLPGAADAIRRLNQARLPVLVITNQSGIARGLITADQYEAVRTRMERLLADAGASITQTYHCPHGPDTNPPCECRKPRPGMFLQAAREHGLRLENSFFIGDRPRDVLAGVEAGGRGYLIQSAAAAELPPGTPGVTLVSSLQEAVENLLGKAFR